MKQRSVSVIVLLPLVLAGLAAPARAGGERVQDAECGVEVTLPAAGWEMSDLGGAGVVVHLYAPKGTRVPRVTLMRIPLVFLPAGMETRAVEVERDPESKRVRLEATTLAGKPAVVYEYVTRGVHCVEIGTKQGEDSYVVVQVVAEEADWKDDARRAALEAVLQSVRFLVEEDVPRPLRVDPKTPDEVRTARARNRPASDTFSVLEHDLAVDLYPATGRLVVRDDLLVEGLGPAVREIELTCTEVEIDRITAGGKDLAWRRTKPSRIAVTLDSALAKGERLALRFEAHSDDFYVSVDQDLVTEIAVFAQVDPVSCFSSHAFYYPVDRRNDAAVRMALSVPEGYTAVTGGTLEGVEEHDDRCTYTYRTAFRTPRALPFGFAAGRYREVAGTTPEGLNLIVYFPPEKEKEARQRLAVAVAAGTLFERWMGPLPWDTVAICHVKPRRKETGVSLPGLILASEGFFQDVEGVRLTGASLNDARSLGVLLVADELSHQWNFYAVGLPNELAEGISTFTNLLYVESREGAAEYHSGIAFCADVYLAATLTGEDVALADAGLYGSDMYRSVAFCKVPAVLDMLRYDLGDETFRKAWRAAFMELRGDRTGFDGFEKALGKAAGRDLGAFFDQWFFQAGYPRLTVAWREVVPGEALRLEIEQTQPGGLFDLRVPVEVDFAGDVPTEAVAVHVSERRQTVEIPLPDAAQAVRAVRVDPERRLPLLRTRVEGP